MNARALLLCCVPFALVLTPACSAAPANQEETTDSTSEALNNSPIQPHPGGGGVIGPVGPIDPGPYGPVPAWPITNRKAYCPKVDTGCSIYPTTNWGDPAEDAVNAQLASYGCTPEQQFFTGYSAGWLGGLIALCSDTLALRTHYGHWNFDAMNGACDACIPRAPAGQVWIMLEAFVGPNCPNGCRVRNEGGW